MPIAVAIRRADCYSPNNIENDRIILLAAVEMLEARCGITIPVIDEDDFCKSPVEADVYLSMGRLPKTLDILSAKEAMGKTVINSPSGVRVCSQRSLLDKLMRKNNVAMPPLHGSLGCWLKRGDSAAQSRNDVVYCPNDKAFQEAKAAFKARGIDDIVESTHVAGDLIKFYGVDNTMFHYSYTNDSFAKDETRSKFGNERINGAPHHYSFDGVAFRQEVQRLAALANVLVYGGDAIVDESGNFYIIDFNDWPTFSSCREEAAEAISRLIRL